MLCYCFLFSILYKRVLAAMTELWVTNFPFSILCLETLLIGKLIRLKYTLMKLRLQLTNSPQNEIYICMPIFNLLQIIEEAYKRNL